MPKPGSAVVPGQVLASTDERRADFAPYVPVLDEDGRPVYQATLPDGGSVVFRDDALLSDPARPVASHPVAGRRTAWFARVAGRTALVIDGKPDPTRLDFGPAGPTLNAHGDVAARARDGDEEVVVVARGDNLEILARGGHYEGLPIVLDDGRVVFHERGRGLVGPGWHRAGMQRFFGANNRGQVAVATTDGIWRDGELVASAGFGDFRAAALDDRGEVVHASSPVGGRLGVYAGDRRLVGLGDDLAGSRVEDLAFNQASLRPDGRLAVRVRLADGRGLILGWRL